MEEKKQKKIKASGTPAKLAGCIISGCMIYLLIKEEKKIKASGTPAKLAGYIISGDMIY